MQTVPSTKKTKTKPPAARVTRIRAGRPPATPPGRGGKALRQLAGRAKKIEPRELSRTSRDEKEKGAAGRATRRAAEGRRRRPAEEVHRRRGGRPSATV
ncbi:hypothetical protein Nepgr_021409 [Nepenthes gracilis]|uniref:Uncharacterized protein n=1 Tax=Nepenthes gracilis TaxID=150966 RepID=A0AAD3SY51_NEPGR|nr:hypothetical protein Nepgr_021409 [Nepenthes gracilis]